MRPRCPGCDATLRIDLDLLAEVERYAGAAESERRRAESAPFFPFCSEKCRLIDLGRWVDEEYRVTRSLHQGTRAPEVADERE